jgi:SAM-dependent methyltransferase
MFSINFNGYWESKNVIPAHYNDERIANYLNSFLKNKKVVDLGCGLGYYVKYLKNNNIDIDGYDGNPYTPELTDSLCNVLDLSKEIIFEKKYDWVICLEVGEHIPEQFENIFIQNLHNNNLEGIILSWAVEGQGGDGHVNCKNNEYIKSIFSKLGYTNDIIIENELRNISTLDWFKNTIMVFRK